ncbi:hypothetical protein ABT174_03265 [Streptomyces sparsogenes]|uniref:hypothetical protein n=1 Tax=Streptomyces sparsogenes TaxID=67365 RepID=UPI003325B7BD
MMRRGLRLTAVVAVVLVALTGFKSRGGRHGSGGGGGCSNSSSSSHHSSSGSGSGGYSDSDDYNSSTGSSGADSGGYRYNDRYDSNDSSSSSGSSSGSAKTDRPVSTATVVRCAGKDKSGHPAATVKVRNETGTSRTFVVEMEFRDKQGSKVTSGSAYARVPAEKTKSVKVLLDDPGVVGTVVTCEVVSVD